MVQHSEQLMSFSPVLTENKLMLMTHAAESSAFSDKTLHPFVGRMSKSAVNVQAHALVNVVQSVVKHTSAKLISCDDSYCKDGVTICGCNRSRMCGSTHCILQCHAHVD